MPSPQQLKSFQKRIRDFYKLHKRDFPWRQTDDPYAIVVSEIMLQQTQTERVLPKYIHFLKMLPTFNTLSTVSTTTLLSLWQGLGYNRRALNLKKSAQIIMDEFAGNLPNDPAILVNFPGIGKATAGSICAFAFNLPTLFIETNIRRVFIHEFFADAEVVSDQEISPLIEQTLDLKNPREWYYALMDYGAYLGKLSINPNTKSKHYNKQSVFQGSNRQVRGQILRILLQNQYIAKKELFNIITKPPEQTEKILLELEKEKFISINKNIISIIS